MTRALYSHFLLLVLCQNLFIHSFGQEILQHKSIEINYSSLAKTDNYAKVFSLLASNNNKSIHSIHLNILFDEIANISVRNYRYVEFNYQFSQTIIKGNIYFRDFEIDTLLLPDSVDVNIELFPEGNNPVHFVRRLSFSGGKVLLDLYGDVLFDKLSVSFDIKRLIFSQKKYKQFTEIADLINYYYSYSRLDSLVLDYFYKTVSERNPTASVIFNCWFALNRLKFYSLQHHLNRFLSLYKNDPFQLKKNQEKARRLLRRSHTLSKEILTVSPVSKDGKRYVNAFVELSEKALHESQNLQPYMAESFKEFASIFPDEQQWQMMHRISEYYDNGNSGRTLQELFRLFVEKATALLQNNAYVEGLVLLNNASLIQNRFPIVKRSGDFINTYAGLLDGLMNSYLSVAMSARKGGNTLMFSNYFNKAIGLFSHFLKDTTFYRQHIVFPYFRDELLKLAQKENTENKTDVALNLIDKARQANGNRINSSINSAYSAVYQNYYRKYKKNIRIHLENHHLFQAKILIDSIENFVKTHRYFLGSYLSNDANFYNLIYSVYLEILQEGQMSFDNGKKQRATDLLFAAKDMEDRYFTFHSEDLQVLLSQSFTPIALTALHNANLEIWANRINNAKEIVKKVRRMQTDYHQQNNHQLNNAINLIEQKIIERKDLALHQKFDNLAENINSEVHARKYDKASENYKKMKALIDQKGKSLIEIEETKKIEKEYADLFVFNTKYKALKKKMFHQGVEAVIPEFAQLEDFYTVNNIAAFGLKIPGLYEFIKAQHSIEFAQSSLEYFMSIKQYIKAFSYLDLLRLWGVSPRKAKSYQQQIAKAFAEENLQPDKLIFSGSWYANFRIVFENPSKHKNHLRRSEISLIKNKAMINQQH